MSIPHGWWVDTIQDGEDWVASITAVPGCVARGPTAAEATERVLAIFDQRVEADPSLLPPLPAFVLDFEFQPVLGELERGHPTHHREGALPQDLHPDGTDDRHGRVRWYLPETLGETAPADGADAREVVGAGSRPQGEPEGEEHAGLVPV